MDRFLPILSAFVLATAFTGCRSQQAAAPTVESPAPPAEAPEAPELAPEALEAPAPGEAPPADWLEDAVAQALDWEIMPGTSGEPEPTRADELRAFFTAHPEYADPEKRALLEDPACGLGGVEAAHERLAKPPKPEPLVVELAAKDQPLVLAHVDVLCTSDDWTYYSHDALEAGEELDAATAYANADQPVLVLMHAGVELRRIELEGQGFLVVKPGVDPVAIGYDPSGPEAVRQALTGEN